MQQGRPPCTHVACMVHACEIAWPHLKVSFHTGLVPPDFAVLLLNTWLPTVILLQKTKA